jgi:hypothetical protein
LIAISARAARDVPSTTDIQETFMARETSYFVQSFNAGKGQFPSAFD